MGRALTPAGQLLERWLADADIGLDDFGQLLCISRQSLWRWMRGRGSPSIDSAAQIERWTGIPARMWASCAELRSGSASEVAA
jgi:transcriptional regulator with XRE-family HTH domain